MRSFRSILWIGPGDSLVSAGVTDAPTLDITWIEDVNDALDLPPAYIDAAVITGDDPEQLRANVRRLGSKPGFPPLLVCLQKPDNAQMRALLAAGAADILQIPAGLDAAALLNELLDRLDRLVDPGPFHPRRTAAATGVSTRTSMPDDGVSPMPGIVGNSRAIREVFSLVQCAANSTASVLLTGETGSGKEVVARAIHSSGDRHKRPFVAINCAAFPETLLESELFGYVKGAFTGADRDKQGLFQAASGGTLFLDEVGDVSTAFQAKLLRVLQEREVRPVGGSRSSAVDTRVVAATNRNLRHEAESGRYRMDLYYRLSVFPIVVPSLRERPDDIVPLAEHFLALHGARESKEGCRLTHAAIHILLAYNWPGNVRELENEIQRALALAQPGELITPKRLSDCVLDIVEAIDASVRPGDSLHEMVDRFQSWVIRRSLSSNDGRKARTAKVLGLTREGLYKKMKRLNIQ